MPWKFNSRPERIPFSVRSGAVVVLASSTRSQIHDTYTDMSLDEQFKTVADSVRNWKTKPSDSENLALYSLYKQAVFGDVNIPQPSGLVEAAKWKAWSGRKGISQDDAKKQYVEMAKQLQSKYA